MAETLVTHSLLQQFSGFLDSEYAWIYYLLLALILYKVLDRLVRIPRTRSPSDRIDHILITGCDTGFGNRFAKRLGKKGFHVFAACLTQSGKYEVEDATPPNVRTLLLDITDAESIRTAYQFVKTSLSEGQGLWALVNNAGVHGPVGAVEWISKEGFMKTLDVNFASHAEVTRTFLPLLKRRGGGRVVNTTSMLGRRPFPGVGPYTVSKHAFEGFSDVLRMEMKPFGVSVHIIEPGYFDTKMTDPKIVKTNLENTFNQASKEVQEEYGREYLEGAQEIASDLIPTITSLSVDTVVDAYEHAVLGWYPRGRYLLGLDARFIFWPLMMAPEWLADYLMMKLGRAPTPNSVKKMKYL